MDIHDTFVCTPGYLENLRIREGQDVNIFDSGMILMLDRKNMSRIYIDGYLSEQGIEPKQIMETNTMDLLISFARTGLGIGCVIREFVQEDLDNGTLVEIPMKTPIPSRVVGFAYNPAGETRTMQRFIDFVNSLQASGR